MCEEWYNKKVSFKVVKRMFGENYVALMGWMLEDMVEVRNFFKKDHHLLGTSRDKSRKMQGKAETVHRRFLGIDCEGAFPRLMRIKKDIKAREK